MRLKLSLCFILFILMFPLKTNALTNSTNSAGLMILNKDQFRERKQETREVIQAKREEFKLSLQKLRDQKKKLIVERMDTRMANANKKATTRFTSVLQKIQIILNRIITTAQNLKTNGVNTNSLDSATVSAQLAINNASVIVASQSAMVYVIQIATESALKQNVGSTVSELRLDLRDAHKAVIDAKQAVMKAVMERAKAKKNEPNATQSAQ